MAVRARPDNLSLDHPIADDRGLVDFAELWESRRDVHAVCDRMVGATGEVDDVVQDTFLRALRNADRLHRRSPYAAWLATVARRRSIDELRARKRVRPVAAVPDTEAPLEGDPLEQVLRQEALDRVQVALGTLSPRERRLLLRQVTHELTIAELAEAEAASEASVRSVLARARSKLRAAVERDGPLVTAPGVLVAVRRRLQRWVAVLDGRAPVLAGFAAQFGDLVLAVIAAAALLLPTAAPAPDVVLLGSSHAGAGSESPAETSSTPGGGGRSAGVDDTGDQKPSTTTTTAMPPPTTVVPSPGEYVDLPWLRDPRGELPDKALIDSFASSADGEVVLASGSPAGSNRVSVYRSDDGGQSWRRLVADGFVGGQLMVGPSFPDDPTILVSVPGGPLMRSDDGGSFFYPAAPGRGNGVLLPGYGVDHRRVLGAVPQLVSYDVDTALSTPVGLGPEVVDVGGVAVPPAFPADPTVLVGGVAQQGSGWASTVHRCRSFDPCTTAVLAATMVPTPPAVHVSSTPGLVLAHTRQRLHRSVDGGSTFTQVALPAGITVQSVIDGATGELLLAALFPGGSTNEGLLRSTDGGQTWVPVAPGVFAGGSMQVTRLANGNLLAALGPNRSGLLCSADNGATWAVRCPPPHPSPRQRP